MVDYLKQVGNNAMAITEQFFSLIIQFIEKNTGIEEPDTNHRQIKRFVAERLSSLDIKPDHYLVHVKENKDEYARFIDAVTINETYFFREQKHFMLIDSIIFPKYTNTKQRHFNFWSAACSTGEEAVSIAALAEKFWGQNAETSYSVFASDLNPIALDVFKKGKFSTNAFRKDGSCFHHLLKPFICYKGEYQFLEDSLKQKIRVLQLNLLHDDFSRLPESLDLVFLRNTLIYIPIETRQIILDKVVKKMRVGGYLFLSSSESPMVSHQDLESIEHQGVYFFEKKNIDDKIYACQSDQIVVQKISEKPLAEKFETCDLPIKEKNIIDTREIIFFVNQKLTNKHCAVEDNINYSLAGQFIEIVLLIHSNQFNKARDLLESVTSITKADEISFYLLGYMAMTEKNEKRAICQFSKSLKCNASFWPSRYYLGMLILESSPRKAKIEFELCQRSIISCLEKDNASYQFLLEGFHAHYFLDICKKWLKKIKN
jgi:chemotaxis protein methyltransferase CheR